MGMLIERQELAWEARDMGSNLSFTFDSLALSKSLVCEPQFPFPLLPPQQRLLSSHPDLAFSILEMLPPLEMPLPLVSSWQIRLHPRPRSNATSSEKPSTVAACLLLKSYLCSSPNVHNQ